MESTRQCSAEQHAYFEQPCDGELLECPQYFTDGRSDFRCEKHVREAMSRNAYGPKYHSTKKLRRRSSDTSA